MNNPEKGNTITIYQVNSYLVRKLRTTIKKPAPQKKIFRLTCIEVSQLDSKDDILKDQVAIFHICPKTSVTKYTYFCLVLTVKGQPAYFQIPSVKPEHSRYPQTHPIKV